MIDKIIPTTNKTQAICVAVPATPLNPRTPAIIATIRNVSAQLNMIFSSSFSKYQIFYPMFI
jgi:hypothetical protein